MAIVARLKLYSTADIQGAVWGLALADVAQLLSGQVRVGQLYSGNVRYRREPPGQENWQTALETLRLGHGDCEDLAAWRAAELIVRNPEALRAVQVLERICGPFVKEIRPGLRHVVVRCGTTIEDPSKKLGMGRRVLA